MKVCLVYQIITQLENVQFSSFGLSVFNLWRNVTDIPCKELPFYGRLCNFIVSSVWISPGRGWQTALPCFLDRSALCRKRNCSVDDC